MVNVAPAGRPATCTLIWSPSESTGLMLKVTVPAELHTLTVLPVEAPTFILVFEMVPVGGLLLHVFNTTTVISRIEVPTSTEFLYSFTCSTTRERCTALGVKLI